ncbi:MAG: CRISPR-associated helicase Cas3' [Actinomycetaceae bacterium]|nr:CRISPR-associated helicase Cas3' [Actinomycetaceae bacterium]
MATNDDLWLLWAKSNAGGRPHSLIGHLLDTVAVAELIWDEYLSEQTKRQWDKGSGGPGHGRDLFRFVAGVHDIGKATPAFQRKNDVLLKRVLDGIPGLKDVVVRDKYHGMAGAHILDRLYEEHGWINDSSENHGLDWLKYIVQGHHGIFSDLSLRRREKDALGWGSRGGDWWTVQQRLINYLLEETAIDPKQLMGWLPLGAQLAFAGYLSMADWLASSDQFPGLDTDAITMEEARGRAHNAWDHFGFKPGWGVNSPLLNDLNVYHRFRINNPRPFQKEILKAALQMRTPGLMIIEAPMGEGKTEAGLAAAEILAKKFGCSGVAFGMPTQGTTDAMYNRFIPWVASFKSGIPLSLLHGKAFMNEDWRKALDSRAKNTPSSGVDEYGLPFSFGEVYEDDKTGDITDRSATAPNDWLLGHRRGLLSSMVVGTIDQLLYAATRTRYVAMRFAGLAGKVLIIDEVHSYDIYMSQFLEDLLHWCASAEVPAILMSATLPPEMRQKLAMAYWNGIPWAEKPSKNSQDAPILEGTGYPLISTVETGCSLSFVCQPHNTDADVTLEALKTPDPNDVEVVADAILKHASTEGCVLAVMNTVARAQELYRLLRDSGLTVQLLHGRLTTKARADRTADLVELLGKSHTRKNGRPKQMVVVATQIAEQSFDIDADWLVSDIAPMDLLLQRIGRLHRHERPIEDRPENMRKAKVLVCGVAIDTQLPAFPKAFEYVYGNYALYRTASKILRGALWSLPSQIPTLVAEAYDTDDHTDLPPSWLPGVQKMLVEETREKEDIANRASSFVLSRNSALASKKDLSGLHSQRAADTEDEAHTVRDGEPSLEVALVVKRDGEYWALDSLGKPDGQGTRLGHFGECCANPDIARQVLGDTVRVADPHASVPSGKKDNRSAWVVGLQPLPSWKDVPMLARTIAVELNRDGKASFATSHGEFTVVYDPETGLHITYPWSK